MNGRTGFRTDKEKRLFTKSYKGKERVESNDRERPEGTLHIE